MSFVKIAGRTYNLDMITHAHIYPDQTMIFPVGFRVVPLAGDDAQRMNEALKAAGFVGEGALINPRRVSVVEEAGDALRLTLEGAERIILLPVQFISVLFPAQETPVSEEAAPKKPVKRSAK